MSSFETFLAHRYLHTRRKGAFVKTMVRFAQVGTGLGVFAMVITLALMTGFHEEIQSVLFSATAHFNVSHILGDIPNTEKVLAEVRAVPGVMAASPARHEKGLLRASQSSAPPEGVNIKGLDPATARGTSSIFELVKPLRVEDLKEGEILIGAEMAKTLSIGPGVMVTVTFMRADLGLGGFLPKFMAFKVVGTFESKTMEFDRYWGFVHINDVKRLAKTEEAELIEVRAKNIAAIDGVKRAVIARLNPNSAKGPFFAVDLRETNKKLLAALKVEKWLFTAALSLILLVSGFNIVASLVMLVTEKRRDLGVLLALGATPRQIRRSFEWQGVRIGAVGTFWGLVLAVPFCLVADRYHLIKLPPEAYDFVPYVPFRLGVFDVIVVACFPLLVSWLASRIPARRAAELNPVEALRAE